MKRFLSIVVAILVFLVLLPIGLKAQTAGRIVDAEGRPVAFANVVSLSPADSTILSACVSKEDGRYRFPKGAPLKLLRVQSVGYQPTYYQVQAPVEDLTLTLRPIEATAELSEATVTAKRPIARLENGAIVTQVENSLLAKEGTAEDVLAKIPGIIKKGDEAGSLEVIGAGAPVYYINGREVRDLNELKQLSSGEIRHVEVIRSPGARYDASVKAVVRIKTARRKGEGFGFNLYEKYTQGRYAFSATNAKLNYRRGPLDIFAGSYFKTNKGFWEGTADQHTYTADGEWFFPLGQDNVGSNRWSNFEGGFNYDIAEGHTVGARYAYSHTWHDKTYYSLNSRILFDDQYVDSLFSGGTIISDAEPVHNLNVYYVGQLGKGELSLNADFYLSKTQAENSNIEESKETTDDRDFITYTDVKARVTSFKAQYEWPWLKGQVAVGGQYMRTDRWDDYTISADIAGLSSSRAKQKEDNLAAFLQYSTAFARRYQLVAGLRYEHAAYNYHQNGLYIPEQSPTYDNLFPSLSLSGTFGKNQTKPLQLMLSYTAQTERPTYGQLTSSVSYGNRFLLQGGNPNLRPMINHKVSLTSVRSWLQAVVSYQFHNDGLIYWGESVAELPEITKVSYVNKDYHELLVSVNAAPQLKWYRPTYGVSLMRTFMELNSLGKEQHYGSPMWMVTLNNDFLLPWGLRFNVYYMFQSKGEYQNFKVDEMRHLLNASIQRTFFHDALTVRLGGNDLLYRNGTMVILNMANSRFRQGGNGDTRNFYISLNYNFNAMRDKYKGGGALDEVLRRL